MRRPALAAIPLLMLALPLALWLAWPWWSGAVLRYVLSAQQIQLEHVAMQRPHWHQLTIDSVTVQIPRDNLQIDINASNINLTYSWAMLQQKKLDAMIVETLRIHAAIATTPTKTTPTATSLPLPSVLLALIPAKDLRIGNLQIDTNWRDTAIHWRGDLNYRDEQLLLQMADTGTAQLALQLQADRRNQIALTLQRAGKTVAQLNNQFETPTANVQRLPLRGALHVDLGVLSSLLPLPLQKLDGELQAHWSGSAPAVYDEQFRDHLDISGAVEINFQAAHALAPQFGGVLGSHWTIRGPLLEGNIERGDIQANLIPPAAIVSLYHLKPGKKLPARIHIDNGSIYRIDLTTRTLEWPQPALTVRVADKSSGIDTRVDIDSLRAQFAETLAVQLQSRMQIPTLPLGTFSLRPAQLVSSLQWRDQQISGDWQWRDGANHFRLRGALRHQLDTQSGELTAQLQPMTFAENGNYLPGLLQNWTLPLDLSSGKLAGTSTLHWQPTGLRAEAALALENLGGFYNRTLLHGINAQLRADYRNGILNLQSPRVTIKKIDAGFPITDLGFALTSDPRAFRVADFSAQVLGGKISQQQIDYQRDNAEQQLLLHVENLQLAQILALQQNVEGDGILDGDIPVLLRNNQLSVTGALLTARAPGGSLRYRGDIPDSANAGLIIAFKALQNFHYHTMTVRADYSNSAKGAESGDLALGVALMGRNPTALDTPPVNFNLNIHENIPELLQTLQLGQNISDRIEQRIKTLQKKRQRSSSP